MPTFMTIDIDSTANRIATALSFITEGRAVGFPGFSLAVCDGMLRMDVDYPHTKPDDSVAERLIADALRNFDSAIASRPEYRATLSTLPRSIALAYSDGKADVEVAKIVDGKVVWHSSRT